MVIYANVSNIHYICSTCEGKNKNIPIINKELANIKISYQCFKPYGINRQKTMTIFDYGS